MTARGKPSHGGTASRDRDKASLARALGVTERTIERWVKRGCPSRKVGGKLVFSEAAVRKWASAQGLSGELGRPSYESVLGHGPEPATASVDGAPAPTATSLAKAELVGKIARASKVQLEVQQEKNLKDLGLGDRIREARTLEALGEVTSEVAALLAEGAIKPERATALRQLISEKHEQLQRLEGNRDDPLGGRVLLCTAEVEPLVRMFEALVNGWRRRWLLAAAEAHVAQDLVEFPEGIATEAARRALAALGLDEAGDPATGRAWPAQLPGPVVPLAVVTCGKAAP